MVSIIYWRWDGIRLTPLYTRLPWSKLLTTKLWWKVSNTDLSFFSSKFYLGTWSSYLTELISLRLVGAMRARINVRSSYWQRWPTMTWIGTKALASTLAPELSRYPCVYKSLIKSLSCWFRYKVNGQCQGEWTMGLPVAYFVVLLVLGFCLMGNSGCQPSND